MKKFIKHSLIIGAGIAVYAYYTDSAKIEIGNYVYTYTKTARTQNV